MRRFISIIILCIFTFSVYSQTRNCGTMANFEFLKSQDPLLEERMQKNENRLQQIIQNQSKSSTIITIPVVVHVVYNNSTSSFSELFIDVEHEEVDCTIDSEKYQLSNQKDDQCHNNTDDFNLESNNSSLQVNTDEIEYDIDDFNEESSDECNR